MRRHSVSEALAAALVLLLLVGGPARLLGEASESGSPAELVGAEFEKLFERCHPAVVKVNATDDHGPLSGTGFFIDPSGTLYTAYSVGGESEEITVSVGSKRYPATRVLAEPRSGIAILKVEAGTTPFLPLGQSDSLKVSSPVMTIGYPMEAPVSPNFGMVAGFDIKHQGRFFSTRHIRAGVAVQRGQGGGPLINMKGEAVGILISSIDGGSGCFALPIEAAEKVRRDFLRFGAVRHGWIGVVVESELETEAGSTAKVSFLANGTPAAESGLQEGDVLLRVGETQIRMPEDVFEASFFLTAGEPVNLSVWRQGQILEMQATPGEHPSRGVLRAQVRPPGLPFGETSDGEPE